MANTILSVFTRPMARSYLKSLNNIPMFLVHNRSIVCPELLGIRCLFAKAALGIDGYIQMQEQIRNQMASVADRFKEKMLEYSAENSNNMIFTEDLKNMVHLADSDDDIKVVINMIKKYNKQNKSMRFGNYIFGPVVMRMFHIHKKADLALECFKSPELSNFFDQYGSYQILCDILYESQKYKEVLETVQIIKEKQGEGLRYPKNVIVLALASCYKMNTKESLEYALKLWHELREIGHYPTRKATTFCTALAINQGKPEIALEILSSARNSGYTTVRNLRVLALSMIGRIEDIIPILKSVLRVDSPEGQLHTFNRDVLAKVKEAVDLSENHQVILEFTRLMELFEKQKLISEQTLDNDLCTEIQISRSNQNNQMQFLSRRPQQKFQRPVERPSLYDLV
ncbi:pentatricopeptide repeat-containing protein 2, mitochondrial-like [Cylas formicarius]|uniref:pentatricopeptide repeat-containing protein 2, mitochondrial-like n=1 Tax=Cylas formicarius TaxID=197179 RepID=UPI002958CB6C|nr:pentatricopeptide repeat-containing protein 2, mitochondrial-like [Cylas formicarius]